jgi:hypothetical protein
LSGPLTKLVKPTGVLALGNTDAILRSNLLAAIGSVEDAALAMPPLFAGFCDAEHRTAVEQFFTPRLATLPGTPRNLRSALEAITLCSSRVAAQRASAVSFLDGHPARAARAAH